MDHVLVSLEKVFYIYIHPYRVKTQYWDISPECTNLQRTPSKCQVTSDESTRRTTRKKKKGQKVSEEGLVFASVG